MTSKASELLRHAYISYLVRFCLLWPWFTPDTHTT